MKGYKSETQQKNIAWFLPRPKPDHYKGGMPLYAEEWLVQLAKDILNQDKIELLNLFCGMNKLGYRVDIKAEVNPDSISDAHKVTQCFPHGKKFDVILADPPYSNDESKDLYNIKIPLKYKTWTKECDDLLREGGLLIVYHKYVMPNPNPDKYEVVKRAFIGNRTYHLPRVAVYFRKKIKKQHKGGRSGEMKQKEMIDELIDDLTKYLKKMCYCHRGEGTFISETKDGIDRCVYCDVLAHISNKEQKED